MATLGAVVPGDGRCQEGADSVCGEGGCQVVLAQLAQLCQAQVVASAEHLEHMPVWQRHLVLLFSIID